MMQIFSSTKTTIDKIFFGDKRTTFNPFKNCKNNLDIFNLHRKILLEKNQFYNKICFIISYNGNLRLKGENLPESQLIK